MNDLPPPEIAAFALTYKCPDCPADIGPLTRDPEGRWHLQVAHEQTCPSYRKMGTK